jgi:hypothetical protein
MMMMIIMIIIIIHQQEICSWPVASASFAERPLTDLNLPSC